MRTEQAAGGPLSPIPRARAPRAPFRTRAAVLAHRVRLAFVEVTPRSLPLEEAQLLEAVLRDKLALALGEDLDEHDEPVLPEISCGSLYAFAASCDNSSLAPEERLALAVADALRGFDPVWFSRLERARRLGALEYALGHALARAIDRSS